LHECPLVEKVKTRTLTKTVRMRHPAILVLMDRTDRNAVKTIKRGLKKTRKMSAATKAKIAKAAKARWAKIKKG
jgi:hypothetical protein